MMQVADPAVAVNNTNVALSNSSESIPYKDNILIVI